MSRCCWPSRYERTWLDSFVSYSLHRCTWSPAQSWSWLSHLCSLNFWRKHTWRLREILLFFLGDIVISRTWSLSLACRRLILLLSQGFDSWPLPLNYTRYIFIDHINRISDFIISWPNCVFAMPSKSYLIRALLDKLPFGVLFVSKDRVVTWNGWRMCNLLSLFKNIRIFHTDLKSTSYLNHFLSVSLTFVVCFQLYYVLRVLTGAWHHSFISEFSVVKSALFWNKVTGIFYKFHSNGLNSMLSQLLSLNVLLLDHIEADGIVILTWSRMILLTNACSTHLWISVLLRAQAACICGSLKCCLRIHIFAIPVNHLLKWLLAVINQN